MSDLLALSWRQQMTEAIVGTLALFGGIIFGSLLVIVASALREWQLDRRHKRRMEELRQGRGE
jgi:hypothetical protein